ncbi:MAG: sulfotransferase domain-containing protein [Planctomycetes bacterium]|nr:sulfotransferase domain-containing protein [Planctomycetota bacterium]
MSSSEPTGHFSPLSHRRPDFLIISPPKTGSTWLADNLRFHPQLFVPSIKEVKYFSSLFKWLDFEWYCAHFAPAGARRAGEASPSYASLPLARIRLIRHLLPDVKLVFLMRDPLSRAWSHAKHNHHYREANFDPPPGAGPTDEHWRANFAHDWPLVNGDYFGQLRRWSSVFPAEQLFVGFYESIAARPGDLLRNVFRFLGVDPTADLSGFPLTERILPGQPGDLPESLAPGLRGLLRPRTEELVGFLRERFGLSPPSEWRTTLEGPTVPPAVAPAAFRADSDDHLSAVLRMEETFASGFRVIRSNYSGYDIVFYRGALYGVSRAHGPVTATAFDDPERESRAGDPGAYLTAPTVSDLKERITAHRLAAADERVRALEAELRVTRQQTARLTTEVSELAAALRRPSAPRRAARALRASVRRMASRLAALAG